MNNTMKKVISNSGEEALQHERVESLYSKHRAKIRKINPSAKFQEVGVPTV